MIANEMAFQLCLQTWARHFSVTESILTNDWLRKIAFCNKLKLNVVSAYTKLTTNEPKQFAFINTNLTHLIEAN